MISTLTLHTHYRTPPPRPDCAWSGVEIHSKTLSRTRAWRADMGVGVCDIFLFLILLLLTSPALPSGFGGKVKPCNARKYGFDSFVCVCSADYCDTVPPVGDLEKDSVRMYVSSREGDRFHQQTFKWTTTHKSPNGDVKLTLNAGSQFQQILGFGGAFTDAAGINIDSLSDRSQEQLLNQYFSRKGGIGYTIGRVPMASCDFSTHKYSYDDTKGDFKLERFKLATEDLKYKIPFIKKARTLSRNKLKLFGSPWSAPGWMKTSGTMEGNGTLIGKPGGKYYATWANYFIKFLQNYQAHNVSFWGITAQNEPTTGFIYQYSFQTMGFTPETQRDFIKYHLGPQLAKNGFQNIKLMILDDQRLMLPQWAKIIMKDPEVRRLVSGIAVHWYYDNMVPTQVLDVTHDLFPSAFILASEACAGALPWDVKKGPTLGDWIRAESYAKDIIEDLNHWVVGWTDWNLALNLEGGPNWVKNFVDSPIIVNKTADEFYKQPLFYALGQFSAFIEPGSVRVGMKIEGEVGNIFGIGVRNPDGNRVVVLLNNGLDEKRVTISELGRDHQSTSVPIKPHSINTLIWPKPFR